MTHTCKGPSAARALVMVGAALLIGCSGENLFPPAVGGSVGGGGPTVEITSPTEGLSVPLGADLRVQADVNASDGLVQATFSGVYVADLTLAYSPETQTFGQVAFASLDNLLGPTLTQVTGEVNVVVRVTDARGGVAADTVLITID